MEDVLLMQTLRQQSRPVLLPGPLYVSPRRWQQHGVLRQTLRNWTLLTAFHLGVSPRRLAQFYLPHAEGTQFAVAKPPLNDPTLNQHE